MPAVMRGQHEPRGLGVEESFWPSYYAEFGDDSFILYDCILDKGMPTARRTRLIVVRVTHMNDDALMERANWFTERRAFYTWIKPKEFSKLRYGASIPEETDVHYAN